MNKRSYTLTKLPLSLKLFLYVSLTCLLLSLFLPAFYIDRVDDPGAYSNSAFLFLLGWMSVLGGGLLPFLIWLANPLYFLSIFIRLRGNKSALIIAVTASVLSFIFSQLTSIVTSESGAKSNITDKGMGYWLWLTAILIWTIGLVFHQRIGSASNSR